MLKFIKRLFLIVLILAIGIGVWGYHNGITKDNYKEKISELLSKMGMQAPTSDLEQKVEEKEHSQKPKSMEPAQKEGAYELLPLPRNAFYAVDMHSRNSPSSVEKDVQSLASYLQKESPTDIEKARAIYIWITDKIRYDDDAFNAGVYPNYTAEYVLENRKAVCEGFSNLYTALGRAMGLEIEKVIGYSKGYSYRTGNNFSQTDHAWNIIKIDGQWKIFDATWGRGYGKSVDGKLVSTKEFSDYWFDVNPFESIFTHYPKDGSLSFVRPAISLREYEQMPKIEKEYFELGFNGRELFEDMLSNPHLKMPKIYKLNTYIQLKSAPGFEVLHAHEAYDFQFYIPRAYEVVAIDSRNNWLHFKRHKGTFKLRLAPEEIGDLQIAVRYDKSGESYETILKYEVREDRESI